VLDVLLSSITHESSVHLDSSVLHPSAIRSTRALPAPDSKDSDDEMHTSPVPSISNIGSLGLVRGQRNVLQSQLKVQQTATIEAKRSVSSLRKLALRLAVHISVKEARLASHARALAQSRLSQYVVQRNQQDQIDKLAAALQETEQQAQQLLEGLTKVAPLPLAPACTSNTSRLFSNLS
jgi:cell division protein FtsB